MFLAISLFFIGFYILSKGSGLLIDGSSSLARKFNISSMVIGLLVVGIGTSVPEFAVSFVANLYGKAGIGVGTLVGSNVFNILFVLGISSLVAPIVFKEGWVRRDLVWNIIAVLTVVLMASTLGDGIFSRFEGALLLMIFLAWVFSVIKYSNGIEEDKEQFSVLTLPIIAAMILAGMIGVIFGGKWVVDGAVLIARSLGIGESLIALTVISVGTSLPELSVTFMAALRRQPGIAVGNIVGSNIFDFLMILGFGALVRPIVFPAELFPSLVFVMFSAVLLYALMYVGKERNILTRRNGIFMLALYFFYLWHILSN